MDKWPKEKPVVEKQLWKNILEQLYGKHSKTFRGKKLKKKLKDELLEDILWRRQLHKLPDDLVKELNETAEDFFKERNL